MDKKDEYIKSMEFCQTIIERMANNSFRLKQWFLLTVTVMITAFSRFIFFENLEYEFHISNLFILVPLFIFPYLDAYYLQQERLFRDVYNDFMNCVNRKEIIRQPFDMKPFKEQREQFSIWNVIFSISIAPFYFIIISVLQGLIVYSIQCSWFWMCIMPIILIILGWIFQKKTLHKNNLILSSRSFSCLFNPCSYIFISIIINPIVCFPNIIL